LASAASPSPTDAREGRGAQASSLRIERVELIHGARPAVRVQLSTPAGVGAGAVPPPGPAPDAVSRHTLPAPGARRRPPAVAAPGAVRGVRAGGFGPGTARVVIELASAMPFTVERDGAAVSIVLDPSAAAATRPSPKPAAKVAPTKRVAKAGPAPRIAPVA